MPTATAFADAVTKLRDLPDLDLGIHLTLAEEHPLSAINTISTLVNEEGRFHAHAEVFIKEFMRGRIDKQHLTRELDAQMAKVMDTGLRISHIDTHQHLHALPAVLDIVITLANRYGITRIRKPVERLKPYMFTELAGIRRVIQLSVLNALCLAGKWGGMQYTDHFAGFYFGGRLTLENLKKLIGNLPRHGTCELMCHPGGDGSSVGYEHWDYSWSRELEALIHADARELVNSRGIQLMSYRDF